MSIFPYTAQWFLLFLLSESENCFSSMKSLYIHLEGSMPLLSRLGLLDICCPRNVPLAFRDCMLVWTHRENNVVMWLLSVSLITVRLPGEKRGNHIHLCTLLLLQLQNQAPRLPQVSNAFLLMGGWPKVLTFSYTIYWISHQPIQYQCQVRKEGEKTGEVFILISHSLLMVLTFQWASVTTTWPLPGSNSSVIL